MKFTNELIREHHRFIDSRNSIFVSTGTYNTSIGAYTIPANAYATASVSIGYAANTSGSIYVGNNTGYTISNNLISYTQSTSLDMYIVYEIESVGSMDKITPIRVTEYGSVIKSMDSYSVVISTDIPFYKWRLNSAKRSILKRIRANFPNNNITNYE